VRQLSDCEELLAAGADKVTVNTGAIEDPSLITKIAERYGSQCVVLSIDAKEETEGSYRVYKSFGATRTDLEASDWAREGARRGAGEILITSIDRDGTLEGYDNRLNKLVVDSVQLPVIACGGAGKWAHFASAFLEANVSAVATTCVFHFTEASLSSAKKFLHSGGTLVRTS
jgi:cyclase